MWQKCWARSSTPRPQYQTFVEATGYDGRTQADESYLRHYRDKPDRPTDANCPVIFISWNNMAAFCQWLTELSKVPIRLPTEAEWEYACRAGTSTRCYYGEDPNGIHLIQYAWLFGVADD
ncbi:MAG: formylglycine-generating enzyme family protein [Planctomycetota bacterium]